MIIQSRLEVVLIFLLCLFLCLQTSAATKPPIPVGRVVWIKGSLKAVMENNEERTLTNKSIIYLRDTLITDASSKAEIGFTDQTLMTLREGTKFKVDNFKYNPSAKKSGGQSVMNLVEGGFRTITGAVAQNTPSNYTVNTPVATIGVRGTEYQTFHRGDTTYMGWYSGTPCIRLRQDHCDEYKRKNPEKYKEIEKENEAKKKEKMICLDKKRRWVKVVGPCGDPEPLDAKPDVFANDLEITDAYIEPFDFGEYNPRGPGGSRDRNSFCIQ